MQKSLAIGIAAALVCLLWACADTERTPTAPTQEGPPSTVAALGRLEPGNGIVEVGAPPGDRIHELRVQEGQEVEQRAVLAVLESFAERSAAHQAAQDRVTESQKRLERSIQLKPTAIATRRATLERADATLRLAESDLIRTRSLVEEEVVPARDLEHQQTVVDQARAEQANARAALEQEAMERRLAITEARAQLATAESALRQTQALLEQSELRAPMAGRVLDIQSWEGEATDRTPLLTLGDVGRMMAVAEVYETDARFVKLGQTATLSSPALPAPLSGKVEQIADLIQRNDVFDTDPRSDTDSRVVEVRILLDQPDVADDFVHLQVDVVIDTGGSPAEPTAARSGSDEP